MLKFKFIFPNICFSHYYILYLPHLYYDFDIYEIACEVGCILRQPLFIWFILH